MSKEKYLDMCDQLGNIPIDHEIPIEIYDLPLQVQQALNIYNMLQDQWEGFAGLYLGKSLIGLQELLKFNQIEENEYGLILQLIKTLDIIRSNIIITERDKKSAKK
jgi:hypothetical protein